MEGLLSTGPTPSSLMKFCSQIVKKPKKDFFLSLKKIGQSDGAGRWRVCYQRSLPRLVSIELHDWRVMYQLTFKILVTMTIPMIPNTHRLRVAAAEAGGVGEQLGLQGDGVLREDSQGH